MENHAYLNSLVTCTPPIQLKQEVAKAHTKELYTGRLRSIDTLLPIFDNCKIDSRQTCVETDWFLKEHGWAERASIYHESALQLITEAAEQAVREAEMQYSDIDEIMVVSTTGFTTPSLDAHLMDKLPFRHETRRLPIFGWGCAGGTQALSRAAQTVQGRECTVLVLVVELCTLCHQVSQANKLGIVASALFGDGCAAAVVSNKPASLRFGRGGEHRWPETLDIMGWQVEDSGFAVKLARSLPDFVRAEMLTVVQTFLDRVSKPLQSIDHIVPHPGGTKVMGAMQDIFELSDDEIQDASDVLREYGNMSAPTVMFVLDRMRKRFQSGESVMMASLGPGFTASMLLLEAE